MKASIMHKTIHKSFTYEQSDKFIVKDEETGKTVCILWLYEDSPIGMCELVEVVKQCFGKQRLSIKRKKDDRNNRQQEKTL